MITTANEIKVANDIVATIGETPLVRLDKLFPSSGASFYGKLEAANPSGSLKDRTSIFMLKRALEEGEIKKEIPLLNPVQAIWLWALPKPVSIMA